MMNFLAGVIASTSQTSPDLRAALTSIRNRDPLRRSPAYVLRYRAGGRFGVVK
jgi:hypothetical protein